MFSSEDKEQYWNALAQYSTGFQAGNVQQVIQAIENGEYVELYHDGEQFGRGYPDLLRTATKAAGFRTSPFAEVFPAKSRAISRWLGFSHVHWDFCRLVGVQNAYGWIPTVSSEEARQKLIHNLRLLIDNNGDVDVSICVRWG